MGQTTDFAALIGSRICHDLISPIGAINNGLELIEMSSGAQAANVSPEMALISESVRNASARIRYFRIAFGAAGEQMVGRPEVASILQDVFSSSRLTVAWGPLDPLPRRSVRLSFLALMCMETAMPYGGRVEIDQDGERMRLTGHTDKPNLVPELWGLLADQPSEGPLMPAQVQFGLLPQIAAEEGRRVRVISDDTQITILV